MLEAILDLFYVFIFVAGAAGLAVIATLGRTFITAGDARGRAISAGKIVHAMVPVAAGRPLAVALRSDRG